MPTFTFVILDRDGNDYVDHAEGATVAEACAVMDSDLRPDDRILAVFVGDLTDARGE